jgi:hypothetical protein
MMRSSRELHLADVSCQQETSGKPRIPEVTEAHNKASTVTIELPPELVSRCTAPTFHASLIRPYVSNDSHRFPQREAKSFYDFGNDDEQEWLINEIIAHQWVSNNELEFQV